MEKVLPKFPIGAKVFAKLKGYTAWPATVDGIYESSQLSKFRYDVFFYGTNQVGVCREEELKPYIENRTKLGRAKHFKGFNEAVQQMDLELGLVCKSDVGHATAPESENESDHSLEIEKRGRGRPRSKTRSRSRSVSVSMSETTEKRGRGRPRSKNRSRSRSVSGSRSETTNKRGRGRSRTISESDEDDPTYKPYQSKPRSRSRSTSKPTPICQVSRKRSLSLSSGKSETYVKPNLKAMQCIINPDIASSSAKKEALEFLKNEAVLNDAIFGIQGNLSLDKANLDAATKHIDEFFILDLNPLLLKKHPDAVDTFEKLQRYSGNVTNWNMSDSAKVAFQHEIKKINAKANLIFSRMKGLFHIPEGKDFSQVFEEELNKFKTATEGIPMETVWKMTSDPTLV